MDNKAFKPKSHAIALACAVALLSPIAVADDIDLFVGTQYDATAPNVLIVLDNTSNWARQSQQWPGGLQQGQAEAGAIKRVIQGLNNRINVGLMEFVTNGGATDNGGFVRSAVKPMSDTNKTAFSAKLTTIYNNINSPDEKRSSNTPYGNLMYDVYNYFAGGNVSLNGSNSTQTLNPPNHDTDSSGYNTNYSQFKTPLLDSGVCARNFMIFIGNPNSSGPVSDSADNTSALAALGGDTSQMRLPNFVTGGAPANTVLGSTSQCYSSKSAAETAYGWGWNANDNLCQLYTAVGTGVSGVSDLNSNTCLKYNGVGSSTVASDAGDYKTLCTAYTQGCSIGSTASTSTRTCDPGTQRYMVVQTAPDTVTTTQTPAQTSAASNSCYADAAAAAAGISTGDHAGLTCPVSTTSTSGSTTTTTTYSCTYSLGDVASSCSPGSNIVSTSPTSSCYTSQSNVPGTDHGTLTCPAGYTCSYSIGAAASSCNVGSATTQTGITGWLTSAPSGAAAGTAAGLTCPSNSTCSYTAVLNTTASGATSPQTASTIQPGNTGGAGCYTGVGTAAGQWNINTTTDFGGLSCPAGYTCTYSGAWASNGAGCTGSGNRKVAVTQTATPMSKYGVTQTATPVPKSTYTITQTAVPPGTAKYRVIQTATPTVVTKTMVPHDLGYSAQCYASVPNSMADYASQCTGTDISCAYDNTRTTTTNTCPLGTSQYQVVGTNLVQTLVPTSPPSSSLDTAPRNADEWSRFLFEKGVLLADSTRRPVSTYTIDVYNKQPNAIQKGLLVNMATAGGGRYFTATNEDEIATALQKILMEIQSFNSTFASASLPVNATNRSQNQNQVFIGMFRPDPEARPRWFGNLKQYQLIMTNGQLELGDKEGNSAINLVTGFVDDCAVSFWTTDSDTYWNGVRVNPALTKRCTTASNASVYSDSPDGAFVEKGGIAEVVRKGNTSSDGNVHRTIYTESGNELVAYDASASPTSKHTAGYDINGELNSGTPTPDTNRVRPSAHGDVIHSRPLPINYGGTTGVVVYYGANDGLLRAVSAPSNTTDSGRELWAFLASETTTTQLNRLKDNEPYIRFATTPNTDAFNGYLQKDYFFDGSFGIYQNYPDSNGAMAGATNAKVWLYPSMRRGGRMVYAMDVTTPASPSFKWKVGCTSDGSSCTSASFNGIGQTWSLPTAALIKGFDWDNGFTGAAPTNAMKPAVIFGGGYDTCHDSDTSAPSCTNAKGKVVYIVNGDTGALLASFTTDAPVVADVALLDIDNDSRADYAYVADIGGSIYRIDFIDGPTTHNSLPPSKWKMRKIAYTSGSGRKFLYPPALYVNRSKVFLAIGSGDREHPLISQYPYTTPVTNRFYVYVDNLGTSITEKVNGNNGTQVTAAPETIPAADNLDSTEIMMNKTSTNDEGCASDVVTPTSDAKGWFMNLPNRGEQTVTSAVIAGGMVTFSTNRPIPAAQGTCGNTLGEALGYWVNLFNASGAIGVNGTCGSSRRSSVFVGGGLPPSPVIATVPVDGKQETVVLGAAQRGSGASVPIAPQQIKPSISSKRKVIYWKSSGDN